MSTCLFRQLFPCLLNLSYAMIAWIALVKTALDFQGGFFIGFY